MELKPRRSVPFFCFNSHLPDMNPNVFLVEFILIIIALILIIAGISNKRRVLWIIGILLVIIGHGYIFWMASESIIDYRHMERSNLSVKDRIGLVIDELNDPYNPCDNSSFDGPVRVNDASDNGMNRMRNVVYNDFILIFDPQMPSPPFSLTSVEMPQFYFSLSNAAYAIQKAILSKDDGLEHHWMIQYTDTTEIEGESAVGFVYGDGAMDFSCPHYFNVFIDCNI